MKNNSSFLSLSELKDKDIKKTKNRPAISVFKDNRSLGSILEGAYISPNYKLRKRGKNCKGIKEIYDIFKNNNIIFVGQGGVGKTTAFLRLYAGIGIDSSSCESKPFYYIFAPDLQSTRSKLPDYQRKLRETIEDSKKLDGILLLDGLEEAYQGDTNSALSLMQQLEASHITFWVSCRTSFYEKLGNDILTIFDECVEVNLWNSNDFDSFIEQSLRENNSRDIIMQRIKSIKNASQSLLTRPLFATMILFIAENSEIEDAKNEYELIELFLDKWIEREYEEKKFDFDKESSYECMRSVALDIYLGKRPRYDKKLVVFHDLLLMPGRKRVIHQFYHREFLIYFIVNALIDSALQHQERIVWWFSQTFYDDITNMIKPVLVMMSPEDSKTFFQNLLYVYKETYENTDLIQDRFKELNLPPEKSFLKLRDEILYFSFKLRHVKHEELVKYANSQKLDTMLSLGIAYGMADIDPNNPYTLSFAKKLIPGTPEEIRNRGWGMCFFGDVADDGYEYNDSERKPWNKIRANRLKRLSDNEIKYKTRTLDIPLLYCFYYNRNFNDCISFRDYNIIQSAKTDLSVFDRDQVLFMEDQKKKLVAEYQSHLLLEGLNENTHHLAEIRMEDLFMDSTTEKVTLEIDRELANKILDELKHKEEVREKIKDFWDKTGHEIVEQFHEMLSIPEHNNILEDDFCKKLNECLVLLLSANSVEGRVVSWRLMQENGNKKLDAFAKDGHLYQFSKINNIPIVHVWPTDMSSYTMYGSFSAVDSALDLFKPKYVIAVGVAFGINPNEQSFGDVLVSRDLLFYDSFNKVTDGKITLRPGDTYTIDPNLLASLHTLDREIPPQSVGNFKWFFGTMLTGGTVLSDVAEKRKLVEAAKNNGYKVIGGEMEASGIFYACQKTKGRRVPFMVFKGICDWGAEKNGWDIVNSEKSERDTIKDCVQAYACNNAYDAMQYCLSQLNMNI